MKYYAPTLVFALVACCLSTAASLSPIEISDKFLVNSQTKERFQCVGVNFAPSTTKYGSNAKDFFIDSEEAYWAPFVDKLVKLNVNCVRLYQVCNVNDPEQKEGKLQKCGAHKKFMNAMAAKNIYVMIPVISGGDYHSNTIRADYPAGLNKTADECYGSWRGKNLFNTAAARVQEFAQYENTLAFNVGNELVLYGIGEHPVKDKASFRGVMAYPCVKALSRDLKAFMAAKKLRAIPTFYAMQDSAGGLKSINPQIHYLTCSNDNKVEDMVDIIGLNMYTFCDAKQSPESAFGRLNTLKATSAALILSEYGCNGDPNGPQSFASAYPWTSKYRKWKQVPYLFAYDKIGKRFSGGVAYELTLYPGLKKAQQLKQRLSESYGLLATKAGDNIDAGQEDLHELPTFKELALQYGKLKNTKHPKSLTSGRVSPVKCSHLSDADLFNWLQLHSLTHNNKKLPVVDEVAIQYLATGKFPASQFDAKSPININLPTSSPDGTKPGKQGGGQQNNAKGDPKVKGDESKISDDGSSGASRFCISFFSAVIIGFAILF